MTTIPESDVVSVEIADHIATVWLDRPDKLNAMAPAFWTDFPAIVEAVGGDDSVRVIVVAGRGPAFTAGIDQLDPASRKLDLGRDAIPRHPRHVVHDGEASSQQRIEQRRRRGLCRYPGFQSLFPSRS